MTDYYSQFHPKPRTGKECKKVECERHKDYLVWRLGSRSLSFCMECKHAHVSQYKRVSHPLDTEDDMKDDAITALIKIANITQHGGLIRFKNESDAMMEIRKLSFPWWDKEECNKLQRKPNR